MTGHINLFIGYFEAEWTFIYICIYINYKGWYTFVLKRQAMLTEPAIQVDILIFALLLSMVRNCSSSGFSTNPYCTERLWRSLLWSILFAMPTSPKSTEIVAVVWRFWDVPILCELSCVRESCDSWGELESFSLIEQFRTLLIRKNTDV